MAFPTTSVLSSFTGADEDPLSESSAWAGPVQAGRRTLARASNQALRSTTDTVPTSGEGQSYRSGGTFGPDLEAFATIATLPESGKGVATWGRIQNPNSGTMAAYLAVYTTGTGFRLFKVTGGSTFAQLGSTAATAASAGDKIGLECIGSTIRVLHFTSGSWVQRVSVTDSTITAAGYIGLESGSVNARIDDFGGGTVGAAPLGRRDMLLLGCG